MDFGNFSCCGTILNKKQHNSNIYLLTNLYHSSHSCLQYNISQIIVTQSKKQSWMVLFELVTKKYQKTAIFAPEHYRLHSCLSKMVLLSLVVPKILILKSKAGYFEKLQILTKEKTKNVLICITNILGSTRYISTLGQARVQAIKQHVYLNTSQWDYFRLYRGFLKKSSANIRIQIAPEPVQTTSSYDQMLDRHSPRKKNTLP